MDSIKEQYYPVGSYDDMYTKWTTLWHERDQAILEFTNIFHTLRTKMGIKYSERYLVLKYCNILHRYIQAEHFFSTFHPWERPTNLTSKSSKSSNKRRNNLVLGTPHNKSQERVAPTCRTKDIEKMDCLRKTSLGFKQRRMPKRQRNIPGSGATSIRAPGITLLIVAQSSCWWLR
jgi:hypothetical protein